jgi:hypothetical protein
VSWRFALPVGTGERSNSEPRRVISTLSLWAINSVPMPVAGKCNVLARTAGYSGQGAGQKIGG